MAYKMKNFHLDCIMNAFYKNTEISVGSCNILKSGNNAIFHPIITTFKILYVNFTLQENFSFLKSLNLLPTEVSYGDKIFVTAG